MIACRKYFSLIFFCVCRFCCWLFRMSLHFTYSFVAWFAFTFRIYIQYIFFHSVSYALSLSLSLNRIFPNTCECICIYYLRKKFIWMWTLTFICMREKKKTKKINGWNEVRDSSKKWTWCIIEKKRHAQYTGILNWRWCRGRRTNRCRCRRRRRHAKTLCKKTRALRMLSKWTLSKALRRLYYKIKKKNVDLCTALMSTSAYGLISIYRFLYIVFGLMQIVWCIFFLLFLIPLSLSLSFIFSLPSHSFSYHIILSMIGHWFHFQHIYFS